MSNYNLQINQDSMNYHWTNHYIAKAEMFCLTIQVNN